MELWLGVKVNPIPLNYVDVDVNIRVVRTTAEAAARHAEIGSCRGSAAEDPGAGGGPAVIVADTGVRIDFLSGVALGDER
jgi:hypothetical protein